MHNCRLTKGEMDVNVAQAGTAQHHRTCKTNVYITWLRCFVLQLFWFGSTLVLPGGFRLPKQRGKPCAWPHTSIDSSISRSCRPSFKGCNLVQIRVGEAKSEKKLELDPNVSGCCQEITTSNRRSLTYPSSLLASSQSVIFPRRPCRAI